MAVVASRVYVVVAPPHEGTSPVVTISSRHIGATVVAPKFLGTAPVLRMLTPVVRIVVVVTWETGVGLTGPRALESSSLISSEDLIKKSGARCRSAVEIRCRQKVENQVVDQVDARDGWELRIPNCPSFLA